MENSQKISIIFNSRLEKVIKPNKKNFFGKLAFMISYKTTQKTEIVGGSKAFLKLKKSEAEKHCQN